MEHNFFAQALDGGDHSFSPARNHRSPVVVHLLSGQPSSSVRFSASPRCYLLVNAASSHRHSCVTLPPLLYHTSSP
jgi:hypothetical protein